MVNFLANQRQGTQNTKIRMEVSGGGKKPWRQKGTGHARQGPHPCPPVDSRPRCSAPQAPQRYNYHINNKVKRLALLSVLSDKAANGNMVVVDKFTCDEYKTKAVVAMLNAVGAGKKNLLVNETVDAKFVKERWQHRRCQDHLRRQREHLRCAERRQADHQRRRSKEARGGAWLMKTAHDIILKPVITENSMAGIADKKYTFKVATDATKVEIAQAVETLFPGAKVAKVSTPSPSVAASAVRACTLVTPLHPRRLS